MDLRRLKRWRVVIAVSFFVLIGLLFLDFRNIGMQAFAGEILYLQFVPSLLKYLSAVFFGMTRFTVVLVLTLLFGRVYCSTICPLGTFQDVVSYLARRKQKRKRFKLKMPHSRLRYVTLALTLLTFVAGNGFLLNLLDPFSTFGRVLSNLIRPLVLGINNGLARVLERFDFHLLYQVQWSVIAPLSLGISLAMLGPVIYLSSKHGRLYCNTVCPVGALLALFSKLSVYKIAFAPKRTEKDFPF
jgi:polyferredoxin